MENNIFGKRLKELRISKEMSQTSLANVLGYTYVAILKWEKGTREPNMDDIVKIAKYFNVTTDYLFGLQDF